MSSDSAQSKLVPNACNLRQRENACEQVTSGFSFATDWLREFSNQLHSVVERNQLLSRIIRVEMAL